VTLAVLAPSFTNGYEKVIVVVLTSVTLPSLSFAILGLIDWVPTTCELATKFNVLVSSVGL